LAAADLAEAASDSDNAVKWRSAADDILAAARRHLYNAERRAFYKGVRVKDGVLTYNDTFDMSSVFGAFMFGLFPIGSEELTATVETLKQTFGVNDGAIGLPRYENDSYCRVDHNTTGNPWFITSLWLAQYHIETDQHEAAMRIIDWVRDHASSTGIFSEQLSPIDESFVSVAPLTWSHAEYIASLLDTITEKKP